MKNGVEQSTSDCNEDNSVEHQGEITTQETNEVISGDCLEWSKEEEKFFVFIKVK